jgi:hypothetical protein
MAMHIDHSVYPDLDVPPNDLPTIEAKADYLHRICTAWDFGIMPERATFDLFLSWREIFDRYPVITSPAYHAFRSRYGWEPLPWPKGISPPIPRWEHQDRIEGRGKDPCENLF